MKFCPNCGAPITEAGAFCTSCGAPLESEPEAVVQPESTAPVQQPAAPVYEPAAAPTQPSDSYQSPGPAYGSAQPSYSAFQQSVTPYGTGGLLAWSIVTLLLCTIPGIVALVQTLAINKAATVEEQQKKISSARTWCIVGTVLGVLSILGSLFANNA